MPRDPLWLILTEDGDPDAYVNAPDEAAALAAARDLGCDGDITATELDPRDVRNACRRERYAERRAAGWRPKSRPSPVPEGFPRVEFGYMAELATRDQRGRCRCPHCYRFCRPEDFAPQPTSMQMAGAVVCYAPSCWRCQGMEKAPYAIDAPVYTGYPSPIEEYPLTPSPPCSPLPPVSRVNGDDAGRPSLAVPVPPPATPVLYSWGSVVARRWAVGESAAALAAGTAPFRWSRYDRSSTSRPSPLGHPAGSQVAPPRRLPVLGLPHQ